MMFDGQSAVEVHPKTNAEDLKAFTSLSLYVKPPVVKQPELARTTDQFILYLGSKNVRTRSFIYIYFYFLITVYIQYNVCTSFRCTA